MARITGVESTLRSITYFLPGRFKDAELAGEAIYSALNLVGLYHDSILVRALTQQHPHSSPAHAPAAPASRDKAALAVAPPSVASKTSASSSQSLTFSEHARYTQHFSHRSSAYKLVARTLVIVGYLELLVEMAARRKLTKKRAWDVVATIEALKALLRLSLVHMTGGRMSIQPPIPEREVDPAMLEEERAKAIGSFANSLDRARDANASPSAPHGYWKGARTGYLRPTLASLRPGSAEAKDEEARRGERDKEAAVAAGAAAPPHLRALGMTGGAHNSGSDSDDTLVDHAKLNGSTSLSSSRTLGRTGPHHGAVSPTAAAKLEPWTEKQINDYLLSRVLSINDVRRPEDLVRPLKNRLGQAAEAVWILRPLLYVLAIRRWGRRHTAPFLLSFCLEYLARTMRKRSLGGHGSASSSSLLGNPLVAALMGGNPVLGLVSSFLGGGGAGEKEKRPISSVEEGEWAKRDRSFWWYLVRGPVWYGWTRPKLAKLVERTENRAVVGLVGGIVGDYLPLVDEYYFYSAT
ncbi:hypothetical protein ACQY0O_002096 [Thecaphora frezii]